MDKIHRSVLAIVASLFVVLTGCTKTTTVIEVQPSSTGKIEGIVRLYEMDCTPSVSSAGVTVNLLGTDHTAITDSAGHYELDSISAGYYTTHFSKAGFADHYYWFQFGFVGAGIQQRGYDYLYRVRNWRTTLSSVSSQKQIFGSDTEFYVTATPYVVDSSGTNSTTGANLIYFIGRRPNINYSDTTTWFFSGTGPLSGKQVSSGDTLYMVAYPSTCSTTNEPETYYSGDTLKSIYPGLGPPSNVVKFVLP